MVTFLFEELHDTSHHVSIQQQAYKRKSKWKEPS